VVFKKLKNIKVVTTIKNKAQETFMVLELKWTPNKKVGRLFESLVAGSRTKFLKVEERNSQPSDFSEDK